MSVFPAISGFFTVAMKLRNIVFCTSAVLAAVSSLMLLSHEFRGHTGQYNAAYFPNKTSPCNIMSRHVIGASGRDRAVRDKHQAYSRDSLLFFRNVPLCDSAVRSAVDQLFSRQHRRHFKPRGVEVVVAYSIG